MKIRAVLLILVGAAGLCGCAMRVVNSGNAHCERRVQSDRERCLRNIQSNEQALGERRNPGRESRDSWAAETMEGIESAAGKQGR